MQTVKDNLNALAHRVRELLKDLLLRHSVIYEWNTRDSPVLVISTRGNFAYRELDQAGRQVQSQLLKLYDRYYQLMKVLFEKQPPEIFDELKQTDVLVRATINQEMTWNQNTAEAFEQVSKALESQIELLNHIHSATDGMPSFLPDTNALILSPDISKWSFPDAPRFTIVLFPTILGELDSLKINHRNEVVREKAERMIKTIKGLRNQGSLMEGVTVVRDKIVLVATATEPARESMLPWFDPDNNDDRFLCSALEYMRTHVRSPVAVVTADINMQNKCQYAEIEFVEPPDLSIISAGA